MLGRHTGRQSVHRNRTKSDRMLTVDEALQSVLVRASVLSPASVSLDDALGLVLAEEVTSDVDSPPHDKAMVDGFAVIASDLASGQATLPVIEDVMAGQVPRLDLMPGNATRIMTGAPIPAGADAVVMVEVSADAGDGKVKLADGKVTSGQNILRRGRSLFRGQVVLKVGARIRAVEIGLLAEVGRAIVSVVPRPRVAVLATGNELVPLDRVPGPGQIRNSNGPMLVAAVRETGAEAIHLGIARDDEADLTRLIEAGLNSDVLLLSGGVSAGMLDLVPGVLKSLGVREVFHKVNLKPGKPIWFGQCERGGRQTLVFGLPGNPVGSWVCFELFVRPALAKLAGRNVPQVKRTSGVLVSQVTQRGDRPTFFPAAYREATAGPTIEPLAWQGSADLATLAQANALAMLPPGDRVYVAGERVEVYLPWGDSTGY
jgi:molybdopterin molybdotransferase